MKICIVTVNATPNCGTFFQSRMLRQMLLNLGHDVDFLETNTKHSHNVALRTLIYHLLTNKNKFIFSYKRYKNLRKFNEDIPLVKYNNYIEKQYDLFILGSDTIWNVRQKFMRRFPFFWGAKLPLEKTISYAPSINTSTFDELRNFRYINNISQLANVSVRDRNSKYILSRIINKDIYVVCDPTLFFDSIYYESIMKKCPYDDFILIYGSRNEELLRVCKQFAAKERKCILHYDKYDANDLCVPAEPYEFLGYFYKASYIITDTFHGTIFSIIFRKKFITYTKDSIKVLELLNQFDLTSRNIVDVARLDDILTADYNIKAVEEKILLVKEYSLDYLKSAIDTLKQKVTDGDTNILRKT